MSQGSARAGFFAPGRITLGAHYGRVARVDRDPQSARGSLLKTNSKVSFYSDMKKLIWKNVL